MKMNQMAPMLRCINENEFHDKKISFLRAVEELFAVFTMCVHAC